MEEIWRGIQGYEGLYEVSNLGRVKSCERMCKTGRQLAEHLLPEKILKPRLEKDGYLRIGLYKDSKPKFFNIHRLVAQAFIPNPANKPFINHLDCNRQNNCVDNLEWVTHKENIQYREKMGNGKGTENLKKRDINKTIQAIQTACNKPCIATNFKTGEEIYFKSQTEAAKFFNVTLACINNILKGKQKQTKGFTFKYANENKQENALF